MAAQARVLCAVMHGPIPFRRRTVVQQGPPPPRSGRVPPGRTRRDWSDDDYSDDGEEYPPWAVPGTMPRWADHEERERRRLRDGPSDTAREAGTQQQARRRAPDGDAPPGRRSARGRAAASARRG